MNDKNQKQNNRKYLLGLLQGPYDELKYCNRVCEDKDNNKSINQKKNGRWTTQKMYSAMMEYVKKK